MKQEMKEARTERGSIDLVCFRFDRFVCVVMRNRNGSGQRSCPPLQHSCPLFLTPAALQRSRARGWTCLMEGSTWRWWLADSHVGRPVLLDRDRKVDLAGPSSAIDRSSATTIHTVSCCNDNNKRLEGWGRFGSRDAHDASDRRKGSRSDHHPQRGAWVGLHSRDQGGTPQFLCRRRKGRRAASFVRSSGGGVMR